jgi:erythrocyte band 7 integral membrane protein
LYDFGLLRPFFSNISGRTVSPWQDWLQEFLFSPCCRNVLGTKNLGDILSEREGIASMMQATLDEATDPWGVKVERVEV